MGHPFTELHRSILTPVTFHINGQINPYPRSRNQVTANPLGIQLEKAPMQ